MINIEEKINYTGLEESIHWLTKINDARLYWLWMRYFISVGASSRWTGFSNALPVLNTMQPVTDVLSWSLFGGRFVMQSLWVIQRSVQPAEERPSSIEIMSCLNDFLWGTSNFLSAQWLHGNELRPSVGALGWWGNVCMEVLLVYDVIFVALQFRHEESQGRYRKQVLLSAMVYNTSLACGFLLFRGFSTPINNNVPPYVGAGLCVLSTGLFRINEWAMVLSKVKNKQPNIMESQLVFQQACIGAGLSVGLDLLLPLYIWMSSDTNNLILLIALSLSANIVLNGCFKRDKASPLGRCSLFSSHQSPGVLPVSVVSMSHETAWN